MARVIAQPCIGVKSGECVDVCPVDCIHPNKNKPEGAAKFGNVDMLYIDPSTCIDCGQCELVCPVEAIYPDRDLPDEWKHFEQLNADYFVKT